MTLALPNGAQSRPYGRLFSDILQITQVRKKREKTQQKFQEKNSSFHDCTGDCKTTKKPAYGHLENNDQQLL